MPERMRIAEHSARGGAVVELYPKGAEIVWRNHLTSCKEELKGKRKNRRRRDLRLKNFRDESRICRRNLQRIIRLNSF